MIISCGEALIDFFKSNDGQNFTPMVGGSLLNVAVAIQKSGRQSALLSNLSTDQFGQKLLAYLKHNNVDTQYITRSDHMTGLIFVHYNADKSAHYSYYGSNTAEKNYNYASKTLQFNDDVNCLHFGSFSLVVGQTSTSYEALIKAEYKNKIISIDLNIRATIEPNMQKWQTQFERLLPFAHIAKASSEDVMTMYGLTTIDRKTCFEYMREWQKIGAKMLVITAAERGAYLLWQDQEFHVPAQNPTIVDTVGAGDCFIANFLSHLDKQALLTNKAFPSISPAQLTNATKAAIKAASYTLTQKGAVFP